jgi:hypothetical protein
MHSTSTEDLVRINLGWLDDLLQLTARLTDSAWSTSPAQISGQRVGSHVRHILDFYECFLDGIGASRINYEARRRDDRIATDRRYAAENIRLLIRSFTKEARLLRDREVLIGAEEGEEWLPSSISRELQALSTHTIHHFALIAFVARLHGVHLDPDFGMSPSTLRYQSQSSAEAA